MEVMGLVVVGEADGRVSAMAIVMVAMVVEGSDIWVGCGESW